MSLTKTTVQAPESDHALALDVQVAGMTITVKAGDFRICGVDYQLGEDQEFDASADDTEETCLDAYLVVDKSDDSVALLVDERVGVEPGYSFAPDGPYTLLEQLYTASIPADTTDLDDATIRVREIVAAPPALPPTPEEPE